MFITYKYDEWKHNKHNKMHDKKFILKINTKVMQGGLLHGTDVNGCERMLSYPVQS